MFKGGKEKALKCTSCIDEIVCPACSRGAVGGDDADIAASLKEALGKIDFLTKEIKSLRVKVDKLESSNVESVSSDSGSSGERGRKARKSKTGNSSKKKDALEDEKVRSLRLMKSKLKDRGKASSISADDETSDSSLDMDKMRKKMSKKEREACERKIAAQLKASGAAFPEEESESGTDSS